MSDVLYDPVLIPPLLSTCLALTSSRTRIPDVVIGYRIRFPEYDSPRCQKLFVPKPLFSYLPADESKAIFKSLTGISMLSWSPMTGQRFQRRCILCCTSLAKQAEITQLTDAPNGFQARLIQRCTRRCIGGPPLPSRDGVGDALSSQRARWGCHTLQHPLGWLRSHPALK
jgi:hypothetical protein